MKINQIKEEDDKDAEEKNAMTEVRGESADVHGIVDVRAVEVIPI